jgi:hypothetical protein
MSPEAPLWAGAAAALGMMLAAMMVGAVALIIVGRRRGPSQLASARAIDGAQELKEVVASGFAFERDGRQGVLEEMAKRAAVQAVQGFSAVNAFELPGLRPRGKTLAKAVGIAALVALFGSYHPALASILASPPTEREMSAAAALDELARQFEQGRSPGDRDRAREGDRDRDRADEGLDPSRSKARSEMARKAQALARAARRGDRSQAMRDLDDLRRSGQEASREAEAMRAALRQIAKALSIRPARGTKGSKTASGEGEGERSGSKSGEARRGEGERGEGDKAGRDKAAEAMRELAKQLRERREGAEGETGMSKASKRAMRRAELEALARAVAHSKNMSGSAEEQEMAARLAEALTKAGEALGAGDREEAARRLEEAAARAAELEAAREATQREAEAIARMLEAAGALGRAMQAALAGKNGQSGEQGMSMGMAMMGAGENGEGMGEGEGEGMSKNGQSGSSSALARALALRLAAMGMGGDPSGRPGTGPEGHADNWGGSQSGLPVKGSIRARSAVDEGQMAVTAIQGMGRNAEPTKEYRDVFPSYSALAEEAIGDEVVPAAQRQVVRRYFESIRPGGAPASSEDEPAEQEEAQGGEPAASEQ